MRLSEQYGLTWNDVDFARREINLDRTQNGSSRNIPTNGTVIKAMEELRSKASSTTKVRLACRVRAANHIRALLLSLISRLPVTHQSIHGERNDVNYETLIRAEMTIAGRKNEAMEQVVMRLWIEEDVSKLSWSIAQSAME